MGNTAGRRSGRPLRDAEVRGENQNHASAAVHLDFDQSFVIVQLRLQFTALDFVPIGLRFACIDREFHRQ